MSPISWTTQDGRTLLIWEMTTSHLQNTISWLERKAKRLQQQDRAREESDLLGAIATTQGEMALDALESCLARIMKDDSTPREWLARQPIYRALRRELRRRHV